MEFSEKELEDMILSIPKEEIKKRGLVIKGKILRQLRIGSYGVADIVSINRAPLYGGGNGLEITIYELKKDKIDFSSLLQLIRYTKGIRSYLDQRTNNIPYFFNLILIGNRISSENGFIFLPEVMTSTIWDTCPCGEVQAIDFYTYSLNYNGIQFMRLEDKVLSNEGFFLHDKSDII